MLLYLVGRQNRDRAALRAGLAALGELGIAVTSMGGTFALDHLSRTGLLPLGILVGALVGSRIASNVNRFRDLRNENIGIGQYDQWEGEGRRKRLIRGLYRSPQWEKMTPAYLK